MGSESGAAVNDGDLHTRQTAKLFALAVRNGVEDLHAAGAFDDEEAPLLNRAIRDRIYEALLAIDAAGSEDEARADVATVWLIAYADLSTEDPLRGALPQAVERGLREFGACAGKPPETVEAMVAAGMDELLKAISLYGRALGGDEVSGRELGLLLAMVPGYWEEPEVRPGFLGPV
jgi:hypothetical protein